jgi:hypothetical protein
VPPPERYALHKLIVSRRAEAGRAKAPKDIAQASALLQALQQTRQRALVADMWQEAWSRGPAWRQALTLGAERLDEAGAEALREALGGQDLAAPTAP